MPTTTQVSPSGTPDIDGLLYVRQWAVSSLTFSFPTSASYYQSGSAPNGESITNFGALSAAQQAYVRSALTQYSSVIPITFTEITETSSQHADLRFAKSDAPSTAWGYLPSTSAAGGDSWYNNSSHYYDNPVRGNYAAHTFLHEIGHTMGLLHGHDETNPYGALPSHHDSLEYSVMTYNSYVGDAGNGYTYQSWSAPQTLMQNDIAALQYMYGANYNTNSGNTVYTWDPISGRAFVDGIGQSSPGGNKIFMTVWDGGGTDTFDFSNYSTNLTVDLRPGHWTTVSTAQLADLGYFGGAGRHMAAGNIATALLYQDNAQSLIENAFGGAGHDVIVGNEINNALRGASGNDSLDGLEGIDTAVYLGLRSYYQITEISVTVFRVVDLRGGSPDGTDTLSNIEYVQFVDGTVNLLNHAPTVAPLNAVLANGQSLAAGALCTASDADNDAIAIYRFYDQTPDAASGHFVVNGVVQSANRNIDVAAADLPNSTFVGGSVSDHLWVQVFDGLAWSSWQELFVGPVPNQISAFDVHDFPSYFDSDSWEPYERHPAGTVLPELFL